jgi:hypothetical protein
MVGFFGYDTVRYIEGKLATHESPTSPRPRTSRCCCRSNCGRRQLVRQVVSLFTPIRVSPTRMTKPPDCQSWPQCCASGAELEEKPRQPEPYSTNSARMPRGGGERAKRHIFDGDIAARVLSQRQSQL